MSNRDKANFYSFLTFVVLSSLLVAFNYFPLLTSSFLLGVALYFGTVRFWLWYLNRKDLNNQAEKVYAHIKSIWKDDDGIHFTAEKRNKDV